MGFTLWFTGLSGAGKTTLSRAVYLEIRRRSLNAELLDGDIIRTNFSQELKFTKRDRDINVKRIGFVAHLLNKNRVNSVVAAIAPYAETRALNRRLLDNYVEVYCCCPLDVVAERDVKGLYKRAVAGEIENFTGVSDPYEPPEDAEIVVHTDRESVEESYCKIIRWLEQRGYIPTLDQCTLTAFSDADENAWRERLRQLGFAKS
jgi:adenylylsulfate kinase